MTTFQNPSQDVIADYFKKNAKNHCCCWFITS